MARQLWHIGYGILVMAYWLWHIGYGILVMAYWLWDIRYGARASKAPRQESPSRGRSDHPTREKRRAAIRSAVQQHGMLAALSRGLPRSDARPVASVPKMLVTKRVKKMTD